MGLPSFIGEVPDYEVRDGRMFVTIRDFQLVMPLHVFQAGAARAAEAIAKWQLKTMDNGAVVPLRRKRKR